MRRLLLLAIALLTTMTALGQAVYHEASCPAVDPQRMTRMKRQAAEARGLLPAPDCHPGLRMRYLGISADGAMFPTTFDNRIHVREYTRDDGTGVREHWRSAPERDAHTRSAPRDRD